MNDDKIVLQTQMDEALLVFERLTTHPQLQLTPIVLLLNKTDVFRERMARLPISQFYSEFDGGPDFKRGCDYFVQKFRSRDRRSRVPTLNLKAMPLLQIHCTNATDQQSCRDIWQVLMDAVGLSN